MADAARVTQPGQTRMRREIGQIPGVVARILASAPHDLREVAAAVRRARPRFAVIAARGTSDHAAIYAQYVLGVRNGLSVGLATPSVVSLYGADPNVRDSLVVGISQSGASPDVVAVIETGRRQRHAELARHRPRRP